MHFGKLAVTAGCAVFGAACIGDDREVARGAEREETIENLVQAGFPRSDIQVYGDAVYVGRDAEVSLQASREMIATPEGTKEQYRTTNLVNRDLPTICVRGHAAPEFPESEVNVLANGLFLAIQNYNDLGLVFRMTYIDVGQDTSACNAIIEAQVDGSSGGLSGFPANGLPFGQITIGIGVARLGLDVAEHVITHELGHAFGFRHTDFFDRSISCGVGGNEGDAGVGAIHIPGTPTGATLNGSLMNSCFNGSETGEFAADDALSLRLGYAP